MSRFFYICQQLRSCYPIIQSIKEDPRKILQNDLRRVISRILNKHSNIVLVEGHLHLCPCDECFKVFDGITDWSAIMRAVDLDGVEAAIDWEAVHAATDYESLVPQ